MSQWVPHGLVTKRVLEESYKSAKATVDKYGNNSKEQYTPPASKKGVEKSCDIVVKYVDQDWNHEILCFAECKRRKKTTKSNLEDLEIQARGYCQEFLAANANSHIVFACTLVGVWMRAWKMERTSDRLQPMWGGDTLGDFGNYYDTGKDENKRILDWAFESMKSLPTSGQARMDQTYESIGSNPYAVQGGILGSSTVVRAAVLATPTASQSPVFVETYKSRRREGTVYCFIASDGQEVVTSPAEWQQVETTHNGEANHYFANTGRLVWTWRMESVQEPKGKGK